MQPDVAPAFDSYVSSVENVAVAYLRGARGPEGVGPLSDLLDGQAGVELRATVPLTVRRQNGAFFSGSNLRATALAVPGEWPEPSGPVLDPAIGAGDLLLEAATSLPVEEDLARTLLGWGELLYGRDVEPTFVRLAKARLVLLAASRGAIALGNTGLDLDDVLPGIAVGDGLDLLNEGWPTAHIAMNPPFTYGLAPEGTTWSQGRTSFAAIFLAAAVERARPGTRLTAILPDVIRTGSRYERLRELVERFLRVTAIKLYGRFDAWTDIDVFILKGVVKPEAPVTSSVEWWRQPVGQRLGDKFDVHVGPVVPHRDLESGPGTPYLHARTIPLGGQFDVSSAEQRGFQKRLFRPPFVVVRRTSRPGDSSRGSGTIVVGSKSVLVENHLIILKPRDGSLATCHQVISLLDSANAKQWLDERIRCRHFTVRALREMPWWAS